MGAFSELGQALTGLKESFGLLLRKIVELVKSSRSLRMFGSGHSFNSGVVSDETLASLDDYSGLLCKYPDKNQIAVKAAQHTGCRRAAV